MKSYIMSSYETSGWENENATTRDAARRSVRQEARIRAAETGETIEIYTDDSCLVDVVPTPV